MMRCRPASVILAALVLPAAVGCGRAPAQSAKPRAEQTLPAVSADGGHFARPADLLAAMRRGGVDCVDYKRIPDQVKGVAEHGTCNIEHDLSRNVPVTIYADPAAAAGAVNALARTTGTFLAGENWTLDLTSDPVSADRLRRAIGGEVLHG
jgi:hypothetical protein